MDTNTCLVERSAVRELLITAIDVNADVTGGLLAEIDKLPIITLTDAEAAVERLRGLVDRLKLEARCHAGEARAANHTISEAYQVITGCKGEPGNWNGAEPIRAEITRLRAAMQDACDLLTERRHGNAARSAGHNARLRLEAALR